MDDKEQKEVETDDDSAEEPESAPQKIVDKRKVDNPLDVLEASLMSATEVEIREYNADLLLQFESVQDGMDELRMIDIAAGRNNKAGLVIGFKAGECLKRLKRIIAEQGSNFTKLIKILAEDGLKNNR